MRALSLVFAAVLASCQTDGEPNLDGGFMTEGGAAETCSDAPGDGGSIVACAGDIGVDFVTREVDTSCAEVLPLEGACPDPSSCISVQTRWEACVEGSPRADELVQSATGLSWLEYQFDEEGNVTTLLADRAGEVVPSFGHHEILSVKRDSCVASYTADGGAHGCSNFARVGSCGRSWLAPDGRSNLSFIANFGWANEFEHGCLAERVEVGDIFGNRYIWPLGARSDWEGEGIWSREQLGFFTGDDYVIVDRNDFSEAYSGPGELVALAYGAPAALVYGSTELHFVAAGTETRQKEWPGTRAVAMSPDGKWSVAERQIPESPGGESELGWWHANGESATVSLGAVVGATPPQLVVTDDGVVGRLSVGALHFFTPEGGAVWRSDPEATLVPEGSSIAPGLDSPRVYLLGEGRVVSLDIQTVAP